MQSYRLATECLESCRVEKNLEMLADSISTWESCVQAPRRPVASWLGSAIVASRTRRVTVPFVLRIGEATPWILCSSLQERHWGPVVSPEKRNRAGEGIRAQVCWGAAEEAGGAQLGEKNDQMESHHSLQMPLRGWLGGGRSLLSGNKWQQEKVLKLCQGGLCWILGKIYSLSVVKPWKSCTGMWQSQHPWGVFKDI